MTHYNYSLALLALLGLLLVLRRRRTPAAPRSRRCGLCQQRLLYDESAVCGPCAVDCENGHWPCDEPVTRPLVYRELNLTKHDRR